MRSHVKRFRRSLFIFRRDLRCDDNTGLIEALKNSDRVIPCFIFDPRQIQAHPFQSQTALEFMMESLEDLTVQLKRRQGRLFLFQGKSEEVINRLIDHKDIDAVYVNEDYTPFSVKRDLAIKKSCENKKVVFHSYCDALLHDPRSVFKDGGGAYTVFTPFWRKASQKTVAKPVVNLFNNFYSKSLALEVRDILKKLQSKATSRRTVLGGRKRALKILENLEPFRNYDEDRDIPAKALTTGLSAHHKFGTCSLRETYAEVKNQLGAGHTLLKELYWRDFFTHVAYHFPHVFDHAFYEEYDSIRWSVNEKHFKAWCEGQTGFPIVDAGMRELNATGFMHNRVRMITASFLVKDLHIDWRRGEKYFAQKLVDYDPCVNNGNWQWAASTGCDHQPYFRIFNPWLQQKRFDPDCCYIKKWIPELKILDAHSIHVWYETRPFSAVDYHAPIIDHKAESEKAKKMFKDLKGREV